jgi:hypothetical protein
MQPIIWPIEGSNYIKKKYMDKFYILLENWCASDEIDSNNGMLNVNGLKGDWLWAQSQATPLFHTICVGFESDTEILKVNFPRFKKQQRKPTQTFAIHNQYTFVHIKYVISNTKIKTFKKYTFLTLNQALLNDEKTQVFN